MGPPITQLSPELLRDYPALSAFSQFIEQQQNFPPAPAEIEVNYEHPHDGIVMMNYIGRNNSVYVAQLDANAQLLRMRLGRVNRIVHGMPEPDWQEPTQRPFEGLCQTVKTLGGDMEANAPCREPVKPNKIAWTTAMLGLNWAAFGIAGMVGRRAMTRELGQAARILRRPIEVPRSHLNPTRAGILASGAAYQLAYFPLGDLLGMSENDHSLERRALALGLGYGAYRGVETLFGRYGRASGLNPLRFGSTLISAALVEATLGQEVGNSYHDPEGGRFVGHTLGFFLPQFYRTAKGHRMFALPEEVALAMAKAREVPAAATTSMLPRSLSLAVERVGLETRRLGQGLGNISRTAGRWGGRAMVAGFALDAAYMGINYFSKSSAASARENRLYAQATDLQSRDLGFLGGLSHGVAEFVAPALTRRFLVGDRYVRQARENLQARADQLSQGAEPFLRHAVLFGTAGESRDPRFYTELNWNSLRGDNTLRNVLTPNGRELPVEGVAEQLSDPEIYQRVVAGGDVESQISYIQRQFRGYRLTRAEAAETLERITLHRVRTSLGELQTVVTPGDSPLAGIFDANGALRNGSEEQLLNQLFPEERVDAEQLLALRRVALAGRILDLQAAGAAATQELAAYTAVGQQVGILDSQGNFVDREEVALARAQFESRNT